MAECRTQLDHVVINVRRDMNAAQALCQALGFTVTPRGYHTLGSINHLMMFDTDYFELIGVPADGEIRRADLMDAPVGIDGLVFKAANVDDVYARLRTLDMDGEPPRAFSRPVMLGHETFDAKFRTVTVRPGVFPAGRVYFCEHLTPDLVWREEWQTHANGAMSIAEIVIVAEDVPATAADYARLVEGEVNVLLDGIRVIDTADARLTIRSPTGYRAQYGDLATDTNGRRSIFGGLVFKVSSLAVAADILSTQASDLPVTVAPESVVVRLSGQNSLIEFVGPGYLP